MCVFQTVHLNAPLIIIGCQGMSSYTKNRVAVFLRPILNIADMSLKKIDQAVFAHYWNCGTEIKAGMPIFCPPPPQATEL